MMAYLLGKGGRSATTNAERNEAFADPENVRWNTRKFRERRGEKKYYDYCVARLIQEQATRVFQRGDTVRMHVGKGEEYVGQILSIFEVLKEDGTAGSDASTIMVELKWMYRPIIDVSHRERKRSGIPPPDEDELYWSDHVDSSPAESILGIAHMRQTRRGVSRTRENPPKNFWAETDKVYLCRTFYDSSCEEKPKPLRKLESEELIYLLQNPTKKDLFRDGACFRRLGDDVLRKDEQGDYLYSESRPIIVERVPNGTKKKKVKGTHRRVFRCICEVDQEFEELEAAAASSPRKRARRLDADDDDQVPMMEEDNGQVDDDDVSNRDVEPGMVVHSIQGVQSVEVEFENDSEQRDDEQTRAPRRRREDVDAQGSAGGNDEHASREARPKRRRVEYIEAEGAAPGSVAAKRMQAQQERQRKAEAKASGKGVKKEEDIEELEEQDMPAPEDENEESETALTGMMHSQEKEEDEEVKVEETLEKAWNDVGNNYGVGQQ